MTNSLSVYLGRSLFHLYLSVRALPGVVFWVGSFILLGLGLCLHFLFSCRVSDEKSAVSLTGELLKVIWPFCLTCFTFFSLYFIIESLTNFLLMLFFSVRILCGSYTWTYISFSKLGKFSFIILLSRPSNSFCLYTHQELLRHMVLVIW